ncbi:MAG TPA: ABC transporter substrate-binding protein [Acidimicrobiales bacterium]|nr:ABC transporter substrate-binding protein [Acidimicrobiales bacterium]
MSAPFHRNRTLLCALALLLVMVAAACGDDDTKAAPAGEEAPTTLRLGYFPNLTHATAIAGVQKGIFRDALGPDKLEVSTFNAGPSAVEALFSGALDATYIGPNPAINAFVKSKGEAVRIISGATSGGAALVVKPNITDAGQLRGKKLASPQLGGTQDVALRHWLSEQGLKTQVTGGGDVSILPQENAQTLETFKLGEIDGAWVPEPWASRLRLEGGGKVLVDEKSLWPGGRFVTTHLIVRTEFLKKHPATVRRLLQGQVLANDFVNADTGAAQKLVNDGIEKITTKRLKDEVVQEAWKSLEFTNDPISSSLSTSSQHAQKVGLLEKADLDGIYDLTLLNEVLKSAGQKEIAQ